MSATVVGNKMHLSKYKQMPLGHQTCSWLAGLCHITLRIMHNVYSNIQWKVPGDSLSLRFHRLVATFVRNRILLLDAVEINV